MANLFSGLKPQGGSSKNAFDLSRRDIFSAKSGVLNPIFVQDVFPDSDFKVSHAQITRVDAVQTAPFARMSENYEYYFVPYSQIWHDFEKLYYERGENQRNIRNQDVNSSNPPSTVSPIFQYAPVVAVLANWFIVSRVWRLMYSQDSKAANKDLYSWTKDFSISQPSNSWVPVDIHGEICIDEMLKIFDMLGYGNLYAVFNSLISSALSFSVVPFEYKYYTDYHVGLTIEGDINNIQRLDYNLNLALSIASVLGIKFVADSSLLVDYYEEDTDVVNLFDYSQYDYNGKLFLVFNNYFHITSSYLPKWLDADSYDDFFDELLEPIIDIFNANNSYYISPLSRWFEPLNNMQYSCSVMRLAAYNKVWADIYRNSQYDISNYAPWYNFDYVSYNGVTPLVNTDRILGMLLPKFRQYKKDMFTGTFPDAQFGSVAVSSLTNPSQIVAEGKPSSATVFVDTTTGSLKHYTTGAATSTNWNISSGISALAIRQALSLQRYKERILRAGNRLSALQSAVFGDKSRYIEDNYVRFIGAESNQIDFNSVAATSDAGASSVGELAANGVGTHMGHAFDFHSHDFGVIIGIYYILPESEYEAYMFDPFNTKSESNDFYKPDFMNLGLSPVFNYYFNILGYVETGGGSPQDWKIPEEVLGYLANYWEYKTAIDKVHGNFYASLPFIDPQDYNNRLPNYPAVMAFTRGQNAHYVTPRKANSFREGIELGNLYVNPHDIDSLFYVNSDFTMDTDQFKCNCNHEVHALLPMSVIGLPSF